MASATSSRPQRRNATPLIAPVRALESPLRALAEARRAAPLLYFEFGGSEIGAAGVYEHCAHAAVGALRNSIGAILRRTDIVAAGPSGRWFAALLLDRDTAAQTRAAIVDADVGAIAGRLRTAMQARVDAALARPCNGRPRVAVRAGWTVIEPRDAVRPLSELRHALRGAAVVARIEERRASMLAHITHELRAPLTSILGFAEQLSAPAHEAEIAHSVHAIAVMAEEARRLTRLVEGLIDAGSWQAGGLVLRRCETSIGALCRRACAMLANTAAARQVRLRVNGDAKACVDRDRVLQVLINVVDNALRHARRGGRASVAVRPRDAAVVVCVNDDGPGFDRAHRTLLGTPFTAGTRGRSGLGLAISKMLVDAHGGSMEFGTAPGGGARVTIVLPRRSERPFAGKTKPRVASSGGGAGMA